MFLLAGTTVVRAEENDYQVLDAESQKVILETANYSAALAAYEEALATIAEPVLYKQGQVLAMNYGTVAFGAKEFSYYSLTRKMIVQADGRYFNDALFLKQERGKVYFLLNGDYGVIDAAAVELVPLSLRNSRLSCYEVVDGELHHLIMERDEDYYSYNLVLDEVADWLADGRYYSYDGRYFYRDFKLLSDDLRSGTYANSVNNECPYYNYYLYLPFLSTSAYDAEALGHYLQGVLRYRERITHFVDNNGDGVSDILNSSQLYNSQEAFLRAEEQYGVNSLLLLATAIEESAYGKSLSAYMQNNLFAFMAFDSELERENGAYRSIEDGILSYARYYLAGRYANTHLANYCGTYLGDKSGGLTAGYYTDPYHGEKIAAKAYLIDKALGFKERQSQWLVASKAPVPVYDAETAELLYKSELALNVFGVAKEDGADYLLADGEGRIAKEGLWTLSLAKTNTIKNYPESEESKEVAKLALKGYVNYDGYAFDLRELSLWADGQRVELSSDLFYVFDKERAVLTLTYGGAFIEAEVKHIPFEEAEDFASIRAADTARGLCHLRGVEGLSVSGAYKNLCQDGFDTWYLSFTKAYDWHLRGLAYLKQAYGLKPLAAYKLSFSRNLMKVEPRGPLIIQFAYADADDVNYSVYYRDGDGSLIKCPTQRSDGYVRFIAEKSGTYLLLALDTFNDYSELADQDEHLTFAKSAPDTTGLIIEGLVLLLAIVACVAEIFVYLIIKKKKAYLVHEAARYLLD